MPLPAPGCSFRSTAPFCSGPFAPACERYRGATLPAGRSVVAVPHYQYGIAMELRRVTLEVAEGCNGLRFLMALVTLAAALAQVTQSTLTRKAAMVAFAVPLAILEKAGRVAAVCLAAYYIGPQAAAGMPHHTIGKGVWALALT